MEPRREKLGARTLPCNFGENRRIKGVLMCLEVFLEEKYREGRERREREKSLENYPATQTLFFFFFFKMRGLGVFIG